MKNIAIYSGSFDPIHEGHIAFAQEAIKKCHLDKIFFLVEARPRHKQGVKALVHRQKMVELALEGRPRLGQIILDHDYPEPTDSLPYLHQRFKGAQLHFLVGEDVLRHIAVWPHIDELKKSTGVIVGARKSKVATVLIQMENLVQTRAVGLRYQLFETVQPLHQSSRVRLSLRRGVIPPGLPSSVSEYIRQEGLYASEVTS